MDHEPNRDGASRGAWRDVLGLAALSALMPLVLLGAAGRVDWPMAWVYVGIAIAATAVTRLGMARVDPGVLAERAGSVGRSDLGAWDRIFLPLLMGVCPLATWLIAGLTQRYGWQPRAPAALQAIGVGAILAANVLMSWAMIANRFFAAVVRVQTDRGHTVVSTGPYRLVRHPGYVGAAVINLATPLMLDAMWALIPGLVVVAALVVRTVLEDRLLQAKLPGYAEYASRTRYRLVPGVW